MVLKVVKPAAESFLTDPLTFASSLRGKPLLMINALWDEANTQGSNRRFWNACGRPPIIWLPATHAFIWFYYPLIRWKTVKFLRAALITRSPLA